MVANPARRLLQDFRRFAGPSQRLLWLLMLAGALAEGFGIIMLVPLLAMVGETGYPPDALRPLVGLVPSLPGLSWTACAVLIFLVLMVLRSLLLYRRDVRIARLEADYTADLRLRSAAALAKGGWQKASRLGLSGMQSVLLTEIPRAVHTIYQAQTATIAVFMLAVQFTLAALLSPTLAAVALLIVAVGLAASWTLLRTGRKQGIAISDHGEQSSAAGYRLHAGLKASLAQGTVPDFLRQYGRSLSALSKHSCEFNRDRAWTRSIAAVALAVAAVILILIGQQWLELPFAVLATLLLLFARMSGPAQQLQQALHAVSAYAPAFEAIERSVGALGDAAPAARIDAKRMEWRQLQLKAVAYTHPGSGFALEVPELTFNSRTWLGVAGPSGGGKTTLVDIAIGLISPDRGFVHVDGRRLDQVTLPHWRCGIAYVGQNEQPFEGTVRQNLLAGSGEQLGEEALWEALSAAGLAERIRASDAKLDMQLGDRGSALSGGERQRLAIARALLRQPNLLVLDEATNALDAAGEISLLKRLRDRAPDVSLILIAHRPAPLQLCDAVVTIDAGKLR